MHAIIPTDNTIIMKYSLQYNQSLDASIFQILSEKCNNIHLHSDAQKLSMNLSAKILIQDIQFATKKATTCLLRNYLPIKKIGTFCHVRFDSYGFAARHLKTHKNIFGCLHLALYRHTSGSVLTMQLTMF